tara:strand:- start:1824 stop:2039 length:216 start_codon:yes stop_codon:yes gene_type:complete
MAEPIDEYRKEIARNAWCVIEASRDIFENGEVSKEYVEDTARQIAVYFDLPYSLVKDDLQTEIKEWDGDAQ